MRQVCPTAAIIEKKAMVKGREWELEKVNTTCPYCGVGCQVTLHVDKFRNRIVRVSGRDGIPPNDGMLCVKGRFAYDFPSSPKRVQRPMIKKNGEHVEVSWEEALDYTAERLREIKMKYGPSTFSAVSSARTTNENNYALMKFARGVMGDKQCRPLRPYLTRSHGRRSGGKLWFGSDDELPFRSLKTQNSCL